MVTKRKPPKQNNVQGAPAKPARPSVKGKTVAHGQVRPEADAKEAGAQSVKGAGAAAVNTAQPAKPSKPKRRIAMPQSSSRLKQNQAANGAGQSTSAGADASAAGGAAKPTKARTPLAGSSTGAGAAGSEAANASSDGKRPSVSGASGQPKTRKPKRFSVAKADKAASDQAQQLEGKVSTADAKSAEDAARASLAADAAKRRLERRQRKLAHQEEPGGNSNDARAGEEDAAESTGSFGAGASRRRRAGGVRGFAVGAADGADANAAADPEAADAAAPRKRKVPAFHMSWPLGLALTVLAIIVVAVSVFSWGRWLRYDDAADFQGMWYANGTTSIVTVDGEKIHLTDDVAYNYTLDTGAKTITFTFGQMEGHGRYRFSVDRSELVITDGNDFSFWGNLFSDIAWQLDQAIRSMQGQEIEREAVVDGVTVLDRTQTQGATAPASASGADQAKSASDNSAEAESDAVADGSAAADAGVDAAADASSADSSAGVSADENADSQSDSAQGANASGDSSFQGAVAEGGIDSAGSNAVTLEQLKSGSL